MVDAGRNDVVSHVVIQGEVGSGVQLQLVDGEQWLLAKTVANETKSA